MQSDTRKPFDMRAFVCLVAALTAMGLPLTGYANHHLQSAPMTLERHAWMAAHDALGILFTVFAIWHVLLNRRALLRHAGKLVRKIPVIRREAVVAVAVVACGLFLIVGHAFLLR